MAYIKSERVVRHTLELNDNELAVIMSVLSYAKQNNGHLNIPGLSVADKDTIDELTMFLYSQPDVPK